MKKNKKINVKQIFLLVMVVMVIGSELFFGEKESSVPSVSEYLAFRNESLWESHYEKHGIDMGFASMEEYLEAANLVLYNEDTLHKIEAEDGDDVYFLEATGEFVVVSTDGYIRTYFIPEDGIEYFNRQ